MKNLLRARTAAVVAGATVLAGFGALGAADAATGHLPWNSVGTHQIRNHSIRGADLSARSVHFPQLANPVKHQIHHAIHFVRNYQDPDGLKVAAPVRDYEVTRADINGNADEVTVPAGQTATVTAQCPSGKAALGGGFTLGGHNPGNITVEKADLSHISGSSQSYPGEPNVWMATSYTVKAVNNGSGTVADGSATVEATVSCALVDTGD